MASVTMDALLEELKYLHLPTDQFAIFGSGPLGIRQLRESKDLDLVVKPELWERLAKKYPTKKEKNFITIGRIEIFRDWRPWFDDVNPLLDGADLIDGFRFVQLKYVLRLKKAMNREKDKKDIELIERYQSRFGLSYSKLH